jgi:ligand-binding sensor domain-containing protein
MRTPCCRTWRAGLTICVVMAMTTFFSTMVDAAGAPGVWKTYTSKKNVRDVAIKNGVVWAATRGGMFSLSLTNTVFQEFTTSEGLKSNDLSAITIDGTGTVWVGEVSGVIHAYNPSLAQWKYVRGIATRSESQKEIKTLLVVGDTLYIGSELGFHSYLISRDEFRIFVPFANSLGSVLGIAFYHDSIWVGTTNGVAAAPKSHPNLNSPTSWYVWSTGSNRSFTVFRDRLYAATGNGLKRYEGSLWSTVPGTDGKNILRVLSNQDSMYCVTPSELLSIDMLDSVRSIPSPSSLTSVVLENSNIVLSSTDNGVYVQSGGAWESRVPKGPPSNTIVGLAVDNNGVLWAGTSSAAGNGFMSFDGKDWVSYNNQTHPILGSNEYYKVNVSHNNVKWASSWGAGVAMIDGLGQIVKVFNTTNGLVSTIPPTYCVVAGVVTDQEGKAWICVRTARGDSTFAIVSGDTVTSHVVGPPRGPGAAPIFTDPVIDDFGTIWLANSKVSEGNPSGLYFYNDNGFPGGGNTRWGLMNESNGLAGNRVYAIVSDRSGQVWVGTDKGITILFNPYRLQPQTAPYVPLRDQQVNALVVDPLNNKWVGTNNGVLVLSSDGISILATYTVENTDGKLVSNAVQSIAIDPGTGIVYIGSDRGLSALTTTAVAPVRSFEELSISPNPFYVPSSSLITVDGLVQNSSLKILSIDGHVVKQVKTPGGRVGFWDGKDSEGNFVASGIYVIVAFSENGSEVAVGKVAVLRR